MKDNLYCVQLSGSFLVTYAVTMFINILSLLYLQRQQVC